MKLVCQQDIPGTQFKRGDVVHDAASVALIKEQHELSQHFTQVSDDAFPDPAPPASPRSFASTASAAPSSSTQGSSAS